MRIALLGGNSYQYGFQPSYVHANGRGYITGRQLLGEDYSSPATTPKAAYEEVKYYESRGWDPNPESVALARQYKEDTVTRRAGYFETGAGLLQQGLELGKQIVGAKSKPAADGTASQATDNTALIITGVVAGVAVLGVILASKKKK